MMKKTIHLAMCLAFAAATTACIGYERQSTVTGPSATGIGVLMGTWASSSLIPTPDSCTDFKWNVTEQTATSAKGSFSASCPGGLKLVGTAQGTLDGSTITWSAEGTGSSPELASCQISLSGTAEIGFDSVRVPYSGTTCLGPVSGTEILKRN